MHVTTTRVRYAETDQAGVANHASYLQWFEVGRTEMLRALGRPYARMEAEEGVFLTVVEARLQYHRPARYDDLLLIETAVGDVKRVRLCLTTRISHQASGKLICSGLIWLAAVTGHGKPRPLPEDLRGLLARQAESDGGKTVGKVTV